MWQWESINIAAHCPRMAAGVPRCAERCAERGSPAVWLQGMGSARRTDGRAEDFLDAHLQPLAAFIRREMHAYTLRLAIVGASRRHPDHLAGDWIFAGIVHQRQDEVDVVAETRGPGGGN